VAVGLAEREIGLGHERDGAAMQLVTVDRLDAGTPRCDQRWEALLELGDYFGGVGPQLGQFRFGRLAQERCRAALVTLLDDPIYGQVDDVEGRRRLGKERRDLKGAMGDRAARQRRRPAGKSRSPLGREAPLAPVHTSESAFVDPHALIDEFESFGDVGGGIRQPMVQVAR
jgi:hypothetical protein